MQISQGGGMLSETCAAAPGDQGENPALETAQFSTSEGTQGWEETLLLILHSCPHFPLCPVLSLLPSLEKTQEREQGESLALGLLSA